MFPLIVTHTCVGLEPGWSVTILSNFSALKRTTCPMRQPRECQFLEIREFTHLKKRPRVVLNLRHWLSPSCSHDGVVPLAARLLTKTRVLTEDVWGAVLQSLAVAVPALARPAHLFPGCPVSGTGSSVPRSSPREGSGLAIGCPAWRLSMQATLTGAVDQDADGKPL